MSGALLEMRDVHKRFPGVHALRGVSLDVRAGEVHAIVGENGAGKSTLMHILAGAQAPDDGAEIRLAGRTVVISDERAAQRLGIAIVFQERSLFDLLSIADNVFAARQPTGKTGHIDRRALVDRTRALLADLDVHADPRTPVGELSPAMQQMVEIAKALSLEPRVLILDEPTAALTETEKSALFRVIARLRDRGIGIIYISHRLEEIFAIADRVTVLRDGEYQGTVPVGQTSPADLIRRMVGRDIPLPAARSQANLASGVPPRFVVRGLSDRAGSRTRPALRDVSFEVRAGEILAFSGLAGAGRTELALCLFGARQRAAGEILIDGHKVAPRSPQQAIAAGIGYLSEDRKELGLFLDMSIADNIAAAGLASFGTWWLADARRDEVAVEYRDRLHVVSRDVGQPVRGLSGGNQQKVALAKWLLLAPKVLIVDEPTRGVDVGAKAEMHALLRKLADDGTAVVVISSDLPEVLALGDRVAVMREGRLVATLPRGEATEEAIMQLAAGATN